MTPLYLFGLLLHETVFYPGNAFTPSTPFRLSRSVVQLAGSTIDAAQALTKAGDYLSKAACCLPNWYSSKEGLSGESPAVFGGGGTALVQAGESLQKGQVDGCVSDLFTAACALEPVELHRSMEEAAISLEKSRSGERDENILAAATALEELASQMEDYGAALDAEEQSSHSERETAGGFLAQAAFEFRRAAESFRTDGVGEAAL